VTQATREVGTLWENAALSHLRGAGLQPLARNFSCRYGELDLIMLDRTGAQKGVREPDGIVFVEVRYRNGNARGDGLASVGPAKRAKLVRAASLYLQAHPQMAGSPCRFDVVSCAGTPEQPSFQWIRAAFDAF
jgi:putative endonuclease